MTKTSPLVTALAAAPLLLLAACSRDAAPPAASAAPVGSPPARAGSVVVSSTEFPALPPDVPTFPGARPVSGRSDGGPAGAAYTATFEANADSGALVDWYRGRLESAGWKPGATVPSTGGTSAFFSMGKRTLLVRTVALREGVSTVTIQESDDSGATSTEEPKR